MEEGIIQVAAVSYINTKPLLFGFRDHPILNKMKLLEDFPSKIAQMLIDQKIDLGLVPVAILPQLNTYHIIGDYCIGAEGPVASVCLFSDVPIHQIRQVYLDYQSRTSVALLKILLHDFWKVDPVLIPTQGDYEQLIRGNDAGLVIGDRALRQRRLSPYIYDLAEAWTEFTGLPFVFAAWISNHPLSPDFIKQFNDACRIGLENIGLVIEENPFTGFDLHQYFTRHISYALTMNKRKGLEKFLGMLPSNF